MPIKSRRVNLSITPNRTTPILEAGRQNRMQDTEGALRLTTICTRIVYFFLSLYDSEVKKFLREEGGTLVDLIPRALKFYINASRDKQK